MPPLISGGSEVHAVFTPIIAINAQRWRGESDLNAEDA
jgi:hypothetical protein